MELSTQLNTVDFGTLITDLKEAEISRDLSLMKDKFSSFWTDFDRTPGIPIDLDLSEQAELKRLAGVFLILYGKAQNLRDYQERGKDLLTFAADIFFELQNEEKAVECRILIALGYYQEGAFSEKVAVLEDALFYFSDRPEHPLNLQININLLIVEIKKNEIAAVFERIHRIENFVKRCDDSKLKSQFYNQKGIACRMNGDFTEAIASYNLALKNAEQIANVQFQALIKNSLAVTYLSLKNFKFAVRCVDQALELIDEEGWKGNFFDTKANIYLAAKDYEAAIEFAELSVSTLEKGEDYGSLAESLWTLTRILHQLNFTKEAGKTFIRLYNLANLRISETAADSYLTQYNSGIYQIPPGDFYEKISAFKKHLIVEALERKGRITSAARYLEIDHRTLSIIVKREFPELKDDFSLWRKPREIRREAKRA